VHYETSLNPCSAGRVELKTKKNMKKEILAVLILVLLEGWSS